MAFVKFMRNKFFHPHTFENQKRTWIAEQNAESEKKKQEDLHKTYIKEQAIYENKNLLRTGKLTQDDKLAFMYEPPLECRKKDEKMELKEVRFEWQKNAPRTGDYARNLEVADCPFGIEVRNTKCIKCSVWGHMNTDKICPLYNQGMHNDENPSELGKEDPMVLLRAMETGGLKMRKGAVNSVMDVASNKYSLLEADKVDPEVAFIANLTDKQKRKLMKKLNKQSLGGGGGVKKAKTKKHKKDKKKKKKKDNDDDEDKPSKQEPNSEPLARRSDAPFGERKRAVPEQRPGPKREDPNYIRGRNTDPYIVTTRKPVASSKDEHERGPRIGERQPSRRSPGRSSPTPRNRSPRRRSPNNSPRRSPRRRSSPRKSPVKRESSQVKRERSPVKRERSPVRRSHSPAKRSPVRSPKRSTKGKEVVRRKNQKESHDSHQGRKRHDTVESNEGRKRTNSDSRRRHSALKHEVKVEVKPSRRHRSSSSSSASPVKEQKVIKLKVARSKKESSSSGSDSSRSPSPVKRSSKRSPVKEKKKIELKRSKKESSSSSSDSSRSPSPVKRCSKKNEKKRHDSESSPEPEKRSRKKR